MGAEDVVDHEDDDKNNEQMPAVMTKNISSPFFHAVLQSFSCHRRRTLDCSERGASEAGNQPRIQILLHPCG